MEPDSSTLGPADHKTFLRGRSNEPSPEAQVTSCLHKPHLRLGSLPPGTIANHPGLPDQPAQLLLDRQQDRPTHSQLPGSGLSLAAWPTQDTDSSSPGAARPPTLQLTCSSPWYTKYTDFHTHCHCPGTAGPSIVLTIHLTPAPSIWLDRSHWLTGSFVPWNGHRGFIHYLLSLSLSPSLIY